MRRSALKRSLIFALAAALIFAAAITGRATTSQDDRGAWTDPATGLTWQRSPTGGGMNWANAKTHCEQLNLDGRRDWRLPTISELRSLIRGCPPTERGGTCGATDSCLTLDCGNDSCRARPDGDTPAGPSWPGELSGRDCFYWSTSPVADATSYAWGVHFRVGAVLGDFKTLDRLVRCVH
jgi:hypothetical protein